MGLGGGPLALSQVSSTSTVALACCGQLSQCWEACCLPCACDRQVLQSQPLHLELPTCHPVQSGVSHLPAGWRVLRGSTIGVAGSRVCTRSCRRPSCCASWAHGPTLLAPGLASRRVCTLLLLCTSITSRWVEQLHWPEQTADLDQPPAGWGGAVRLIMA